MSAEFFNGAQIAAELEAHGCHGGCQWAYFGCVVLAIIYFCISCISSAVAIAYDIKINHDRRTLHTWTKAIFALLFCLMGPGLFITLYLVFVRTPIIGLKMNNPRDEARASSAAIGVVLATHLLFVAVCGTVAAIRGCFAGRRRDGARRDTEDIELQETARRTQT